MTEAYEIAAKHAGQSADRGKRQYDKRMYGPDLQVGSRVLVRNLTERGGPGKLRSFWEDEVYVIRGRKGEDSPVFEVQPESGKGRTRVLHRNLLLPCDFLPVTENLKPQQSTEQVRTRDTKRNRKRLQTQHAQQTDTDEESDEEFPSGVLSWSSTEQGDLPSLNPSAQEFYPQSTADAADEHYLLQGAEEELEGNLAVDTGELDETSDLDDTGEPEETNEKDETGDSDQEMQDETEQRTGHPRRERKPPQTLTYDHLGQPSFTHRTVSTREIAVNGYWRPW